MKPCGLRYRNYNISEETSSSTTKQCLQCKGAAATRRCTEDHQYETWNLFQNNCNRYTRLVFMIFGRTYRPLISGNTLIRAIFESLNRQSSSVDHTHFVMLIPNWCLLNEFITKQRLQLSIRQKTHKLRYGSFILKIIVKEQLYLSKLNKI